MRKTIVVSGITLRKGGTLKILREALKYLSKMAESGEWRVVALVNRRELCDYPNIEYIEVPLKGWIGRLWYEYVTMHRISLDMNPVHLWLSMHDVTPRVKAERQAVYCQTSFPFYKWKWRDFRFDPKIPLFAMLTRYYYKAGVHKNNYLIVQQEWLRKGLSQMLNVGEEKFIVAPPVASYKNKNKNETLTLRNGTSSNENENKDEASTALRNGSTACYEDETQAQLATKTFLYVSTADCHKNFETLCEASRLLEEEIGKNKFHVILSIKGDENKYAKWLYSKWGNISSIKFYGFMAKQILYDFYTQSHCLVFPSNIETWGLPISEYMDANGGPMILSDLPYAHNTAKGSKCTAFFEQDNAYSLKEKMREVIEGTYKSFSAIPQDDKTNEPYAENWDKLFELLLNS